MTEMKNIPPIIYLWLGQGISSIGGTVYHIALVWYVIEQTKSPLILGTILFVGMLPKIIFSIAAGVIGDRVSKKKLLIWLDFIRFFITFVWGLSLANRPFNLTEIYILTLLISILDAVFRPIYGGMIPALMQGKDLTKAASMNETIFRIVSIMAPSLAGYCIIYFNFSEFIIFNSITFLLATILTIFIPETKKTDSIVQHEPFISQVKNGIIYFYTNKIIFWSTSLITLANLAVVSYNVNLANLIQNELNLSSSIYGTVLTVFSIGSLTATFLLSLFKITKSRGILYINSLLFGGILFTLLYLDQNQWTLYTIFYFIGFFFAITSTISTTVLFEVPEDYRSRILGIASISSLLSPVGVLFWGMLGSYVNSTTALTLAGFVIILVALIGYRTSIIKYK